MRIAGIETPTKSIASTGNVKAGVPSPGSEGGRRCSMGAGYVTNPRTFPKCSQNTATSQHGNHRTRTAGPRDRRGMAFSVVHRGTAVECVIALAALEVRFWLELRADDARILKRFSDGYWRIQLQRLNLPRMTSPIPNS